MAARWDARRAFPALDLARLAALHPDAARATRRGYWEGLLGAALDACRGLGDGIVGEVAVPLLTMRLVANSYKGGSGSAGAAGALVDRCVTRVGFRRARSAASGCPRWRDQELRLARGPRAVILCRIRR